VQKEEHREIFTKLWCTNQIRAPTKIEKLQNNTHTRDEVFPPVVVSVSKSSQFRFQPKERMKLYIFNENKRSGTHILKYPVVSFLPKHPNSGKPNNLEE